MTALFMSTIFTTLLLLNFILSAQGASIPQGVRPLNLLGKKPLESFVPQGSTFLNESKSIEKFLTNLEGTPPDWKYLYGSNVDERYDRLFEEMEQRDTARIGNPSLTQRLTFIWHGNLTEYRSEHKGFGVAIGPEKIETAWGIIRFKIAEHPFEMVAVPPPDLLESFKEKRAKGGQLDIIIMFTGKLIPEESLMYDFSTEKEGVGMILPIMELDQVDYLFSD